MITRANFRLLSGSVLRFVYNHYIGRVPSSYVRSLYLRQYLARIGEKTNVQMGCRFLNGRKIALGDRNVINFGCLLDGRIYRIVTGSNVSIGPEATILTLGHDPQSKSFADMGGDVVIGDRVWIGYRATILPNVRIEEGAVIAAGAVVTKNVAAFKIVAGVPAKEIGTRNRDINYQLDYAPFLQ